MPREQSWATQLNSAKQQASLNQQKGMLQRSLEEKVEELIQKPSEGALQFSWTNLIVSYGLSFLYVELHFIVKYLPNPFSRLFSTPGQEGLFGLTPPPPKEIESIGKGFELAEIVVFLTVNIILFFLLLLIATIIIFIVWVCVNPVEAAQALGITDTYNIIRGLWESL